MCLRHQHSLHCSCIRFEDTGNVQVFSAAEAYFLRAEARFRGWITTGPTAQELVIQGIIESFKTLGVPDAETEAIDYMDLNAGYPDVDYSAAALAAGYPAGGLYTILSQKWFALNGINTLEVWTDYRRVPYTAVSSVTGSPNDHFVYGHGVGYASGQRSK